MLKAIDRMKDEMVELLCKVIEVKAISPDFGGEGELDKAELLMKYLKDFDHVERFDAKDERAKGGIRPNIVAKVKGVVNKTIWIITHLDVVPEGDERLWRTPPFKAVVENGRVYGRGSEDNGQSIVSSLFAGIAVLNADVKPKYNLGLAFVSDEESGSEYGVKHLLKQRVFSKEDLFIVPDVGSQRGELIEIAEKSILWLKFEVFGTQSHASMPIKNASRRAMKFILDLDEKLHSKFNAKNELFDPPYSTFEPTKREKNVDNVNTIPGLDVSYMDCRILPEYSVEEVIDYIESVRRFHEIRDKEKIDVEVIQSSSSPKTPENAEIVLKLSETILNLRSIKPKLFGIGGNTCASFLRKEGFRESVAWCTTDSTAHKPNEYCKIENMVEDAKVFFSLFFEPKY
ncbi:MAG: M20 family metallo-hydrolase [Archaeoglobaceae archaeon]|nr:M20 family metallo-hydrolase [Archaeoglobaceae archaeon]MDW8118007.1 M20 family metallo-hydrolase [Archaeoglobaceae archaeon]